MGALILDTLWQLYFYGVAGLVTGILVISVVLLHQRKGM